MQGLTVDDLIRTGLETFQQGNWEKAEGIYRQLLVLQPDNADALHRLGVIMHQRGNYRHAIEQIDRAIRLDGKNHAYFTDMGNAQAALGLAAAAVHSFRAALVLSPNSWQACFGLGRALVTQGRLDDAVACFERAVGLNPGYVDAHDNLGLALFRAGEHDDAIFVYRAAIDLHPAVPALYNNLGLVLHQKGNLQEAIDNFERALALAPDLHKAHHNLALSLQGMGRIEEALASLNEAIHRYPQFPEAYNSLGILLQNQCRHAEAVDCFAHALRLRPDYSEAHSNLIVAKDFLPRASARHDLEERMRWNEFQVKGRHIRGANPPAARSATGRKLRIGYVSADFRRHSAASSFGLMLLNFDRTQFEVICYSNSAHQDDVTEKFRNSVDGWRTIYGIPDENAAAAIQADSVDILVDLSGHSPGNRLLTFARRPAPLQITAWGCANGTGLEAMDYLLSDAVLVPPEEREAYRERIIHLPCAISFLPLGTAPPPGPLPALKNGYMTFGYFNNYAKLSTDALAAWATVLAEIADAKLLFKGRAFEHPGRQAHVLSALTAGGVDAARIRFMGGSSWHDHMAAHANVDIALDPFPYSGGISTAEALWMSVPVIALCGATASQRTAASILKVAGLDDWVASTPRQYCQVAVEQARNHTGLAALRATLRERLASSAVMNPAIYVTAVERAYLDAWRERCARA